MKWIQMVVCVSNVIVKKLPVHIDILRFKSQVLFKIQVMWHHHNVDLRVQQCRKCGILLQLGYWLVHSAGCWRFIMLSCSTFVLILWNCSHCYDDWCSISALTPYGIGDAATRNDTMPPDAIIDHCVITMNCLM